MTIDFTGGGVYEVGTAPAVQLARSVARYGGNVTPTSQKINGVAATSPATYNPTTNTDYVLTVDYEEITGATKTVKAIFVYASYIGKVSASVTSMAAADITALTKVVNNGKGYTTTQALSNQKLCFAYPKSFGALSSIKDANGFEYIGSYTRSEVTINGTDYYCYLLTNPGTITSYQQIY